MHTILSLVTVPGHVSLVSTPITEELCNYKERLMCKDENKENCPKCLSAWCSPKYYPTT